jgi:poly-beta-1,6-N-acetyl-D-glucosamine synthase
LPVHLIVVVTFLNEARFLPSLLASVERQTRLPDRLVLLDDGSTDGSTELADAFAARHDFARVVRRPTRGRETDRLAAAAEHQAFTWAVATLDEPFDVVAKLDADLDLNPTHFERMLKEMEADPTLGIAGAYLSDIGPDGSVVRQPAPPWHVRGATKFYRRECYEEIQPVPSHLGWDMIDAVKARRGGWSTASFPLAGGDTLHLRPSGAHDGPLRAFRRWGACAWSYGAHPLFVLLGALQRMTRRPFVIGGTLYAAGFAGAALRGAPRVERDLRAYVQHEEARQVRDALTVAVRRPLAPGRRP